MGGAHKGHKTAAKTATTTNKVKGRQLLCSHCRCRRLVQATTRGYICVVCGCHLAALAQVAQQTGKAPSPLPVLHAHMNYVERGRSEMCDFARQELSADILQALCQAWECFAEKELTSTHQRQRRTVRKYLAVFLYWGYLKQNIPRPLLQILRQLQVKSSQKESHHQLNEQEYFRQVTPFFKNGFPSWLEQVKAFGSHWAVAVATTQIGVDNLRKAVCHYAELPNANEIRASQLAAGAIVFTLEGEGLMTQILWGAAYNSLKQLKDTVFHGVNLRLCKERISKLLADYEAAVHRC